MKPTVKETVNRTVIVDNSAEADRAYDLSAKVTVEGGRATSVNEGSVKTHVEEDENGMMMGRSQLATFYSNAPSHLHVEFQVNDERAEIFAAVDAFVSDIRTHAAEF